MQKAAGDARIPFCRLQVRTFSSLNPAHCDACCVFGLIRISRRFLRATMRFHGNMARRLNRRNSSADVKGFFQPTVRWLFQLIDANDTGEDMQCFRRANNRNHRMEFFSGTYSSDVFFFLIGQICYREINEFATKLPMHADARTSLSFNECETFYK